MAEADDEDAPSAPGAPSASDDEVRGDAGLLVEPNDAAALAEGILSLLESPSARAEHGRVGRARTEATYSWRAVAAATAAVYREEIARC